MTTPDLAAAQWRKSSRSTQEGTECVEVADLGTTIAVRDSKNPHGPELILTQAQWSAFTRRIKNGPTDHD